MKLVTPVATVAALLVFVSPAFGGGKPPAPQPSARALFGYCDVNDPNYQDCIAANRLRNDTPSDYVNGVGGAAVSFNIGVSGDLTVNLTASTRTTVLDLRDVITASPLAPPVTEPHAIKWHLNVQGAYAARTPCGVAGECQNEIVTDMVSTISTMDGSAVTYALQMKPSSAQPVNSPYATSQVKVLFVRDAAGAETFTVTPLPQVIDDARSVPVGGLANTGRRTSGPAGQYVLPFTLVARPD